MTTLIAVYDSRGCVGRCDARCYDAKEPDCDCICGGANHGRGLAAALRNTTSHVEQDPGLEDRIHRMGGDRVVLQPELFGAAR